MEMINQVANALSNILFSTFLSPKKKPTLYIGGGSKFDVISLLFQVIIFKSQGKEWRIKLTRDSEFEIEVITTSYPK